MQPPQGGHTALSIACRMGEVELASLLIRYGADVNRVGDVLERYEGDSSNLQAQRTALGSAACSKRGSGCVGLLLDAGAEPDVKGEHGAPTHVIALINGNLDSLARLMPAYPEPVAADILISLYRRKAEKDYSLPFSVGAEQAVNKGKDPWRRKHWCKINSKERRQVLAEGLRAGVWADTARTDDEGNTLLHHLCALGSPAQDLRELLDARTFDMQARNHRGETPLLAYLGSQLPPPNKAGVKALLDYGADLSVVDENGRTAIQVLRENDGEPYGLEAYLQAAGAEPGDAGREPPLPAAGNGVMGNI